ncbi:GIY-YIG nuclease family protein [Paeniclostridium hominis]
MFNSKSFIYENNKIIYVGKTNNLDRRFKQHFTKGHLPEECYRSV